MTSFVIATNTTSTTAQTLNGFESGVVGPGALLATSSGTAISLTGTTPFLTVLGTVHIAFGIRAVGNDGVTTVSSPNIAVGPQGAILSPAGDAIGLTFTGSTFTLQNEGTVSGNVAVRLTGSATANQTANIFNNGTLSSATFGITANSALEILSVTNTGTIQAGTGRAIQLSSTGQLTVTNTGTIVSTVGAIDAFGNLSLRNTGTILGSVSYANTGVIDNSGLIDGSISDSDQINAPTGFTTRISNSGTVTGDVSLGNGNDIFTDLGGTVGGVVRGGSGNDTYNVRSATIRIADSFGTDDAIYTTVDYRIVQGIESLFADTQVGLHLWGRVRGEQIEGNVGNDTIEGAGGNDTLFGASGDDQVFGGRGNDVLTGNALNDTDDNQLFGGDGDDIVFWSGAGGVLNGGAGRDALSVSTQTGLFADVNLQAGTASYVNIGTGLVAVTVVVSQFEDVAGTGNNDLLDGTGIENTIDGQDGNDSLNGLGGDDILFGGQGNDTLLGGTGNDQLLGGDGADSLNGSAGNDLLVGGLGRDTMVGGTGVDTFSFVTFAESLAGSPDLITGFDVATERMDISALDADGVLPGDDAFAFIGAAAFSGAAAQVRFFQDVGASQTIVQVRFAGSSVADMEIALSGLLTLADTNFVL